MTAHFRLPPIRSKQNLAAARGQRCTLQIPKVCTGDIQTTVAAHIRDEHTGRSVKASDTSIADACFACHAALDGQGEKILSKEDWLFYALRGIQRTLENRIHRGIITVPIDEPKPATERPIPKRKPPDQRQKMQGRSDWPKGRKIQSRNDLKRKIRDEE